jgi:phosphate starvation-inducible membrane PsiE
MSVDVICAVICIVCALILIYHSGFQDGLLGRLSLLLLVMTEVIVTAQAWFDDGYDVAPTTIMRHVAITLFLVRHTYKFMSYQYFGDYAWDKRSRHEQ